MTDIQKLAADLGNAACSILLVEIENKKLRALISDPVEMVAEAIYRTEPKPPGPPRPPFGTTTSKEFWEPYRKRARAFLSLKDTGDTDGKN